MLILIYKYESGLESGSFGMVVVHLDSRLFNGIHKLDRGEPASSYMPVHTKFQF